MPENKKKDKKKKKDKIKEDNTEEDRFKPVANPAYNPAQDNVEKEKWTFSSNVQTSPTPADLQGYTAYKYVPSSGYSHLDPAQHKNAHSAFEQLQKVVMSTQTPPPSTEQVKPPQPAQQARPPQPMQQVKPPPQPLSKSRPSQPSSSTAQHIRPQQSLPTQHTRPPVQQYPVQQYPVHQTRQPQVAAPYGQRPPNSQQPMHPPTGRPQLLQDGTAVIHYARALWNYNAQLPSELSFFANDRFGIINQQPDGWWYAELLDPQRRKRGLVPGNYMVPL
ncbi:hypothetical protein G6F46_004472 [Rhizopus delemar]|nr:hypothetical protein G6F43_006511 [Rhizopus delemar]KAG1497365.1 hypothetical protein G6F54_005815 [Rhizopus delemar]KAG1513989.1 hypothetical protein G6F53_004016 [Rhizopus delemar]KAG1555133.1 hypothetical protein G6F49_007424 [Rhizopus delemar]KAG1587479.1 hypothetical protein G6F48_005910 [Rhizopus delemar]